MLNRKHQIGQINIPEPCNQLWSDMQPVDSGRYCGSCSKIVTDFTKLSNQQIIDIISGAANICGRIEDWQLNSINSQFLRQQKSKFNWKGLGLAASLSVIFSNNPAGAQTKAIKHSTAHHRPLRPKAIYKTISGVVRANSSQLPMRGVVVSALHNTITAVTDTNGYYTIRIPKHTDTLKVEYPGYLVQNLSIQTRDNCADVNLLERQPVYIIGYGVRRVTVTMGAIAIISNQPLKRPSFFKRMYHQLIQKPAKKIFG